ncbi:MAG TPA: hypothetical protein VF179_26685 [Thermoanaerobaculia bacterium]|nr:hypothetical protein [Thermoanaerobaculia bacterium]
MKVVMVVPDGVGIRNFLYTRFLDLLSAQAEVVAWHVLPEHVLATQEGRPVRFEPLPYVREGLTARMLRQAKIYSQLYWRYEEDAAEVMLRFRRPSGGSLSWSVGHAARFIGRSLPTPEGAAWLDRAHAAAASGNGGLSPFEIFLKRERPDVVFCTHQRASRAVPALLAARRVGIPTATFIYSWDNLPKGRMAVHADHFLVWSEAMKAELSGYYPEMDPARVHVVGTPQFEPHLDPLLIRDDFLAGLGLDPSRPVVCFSGDDLATSPHDPVYLADLARSFSGQILFRRAPTDMSGRYASVLAEFPRIAVCEPAWQAGEGDWTQVAPMPEDLSLLANVAAHCDAVVNLASTMALDFAIHGKPAVFVAYDPAGSAPSAEDVYRLPHLRCVHELQPVHWARSPEELGEAVRHALAQPEEKAAAREAWLRRIVELPLDKASERCAAALLELAS